MKANDRLLLACATFALLLSATLLPGGAAAPAADPPAIRVAPPAPVFGDDERRAELAERRARVAREVGPKGMLVMFSAEPRLYTNDVDHEFRQENNLFYLTHLNQERAILVLVPGSAGPREILFMPRRSPEREKWDGYMYSAEDARRLSGVGEIWDVREFEPFTRAVRERKPYAPKPEAVLLSSSNAKLGGEELSGLFGAAAGKEAALHLLVPPRDADRGEFGDSPEWRQEQRVAREWLKNAEGFRVRSLMPVFRQMRLRKSASEVRLMQHAIDITIEALGRAMAVAHEAQWEYEVEAEIDYTYKRRNADSRGYPSIVGCGPNATTLHYEASQGRVRPGDLILMDVGAEYMHYTADITRTFPAGGKFTKEQAEVYEIVLAAQEAGMRTIKPGGSLARMQAASVEVIKDGLLRLGLITDRDSNQYRVWLFHGTGHWLGMNVHDVGGAETFEPGMTFTNEPGIYVRADALDHLPRTPEMEKFKQAVGPAFEKYKNIGVRIEDDVLVTSDGHRNLSAALPRTVRDIERFIARARREVR